MDRSIAERACQIRLETGIRLPDALIAASALEHRLDLASRRDRDFRKVKGLRIRTLT